MVRPLLRSGRIVRGTTAKKSQGSSWMTVAKARQGAEVAFDILTPGVRGAVTLPCGDGLDLRVVLPAV